MHDAATTASPAPAYGLAPAPAPAATRVRQAFAPLVVPACVSLVVVTVVASRLALPLGAKQAPLILPLALAHLAVIAGLSGVMISLPRLLATGAVLGVAAFETVLVHRHSSMLSLLYVAAIYGPLVLGAPLDADALRRIWRVFIGLAAAASVLAMVQIAGQVVGGGYYLDPVQLLPESVQLRGYSITYPIMRGVLPTLKANGMFFVEPSALSQFVALALLGELWWFRRWRVLALLATGLVLSFSGTGLLMLACGLALGASVRLWLGLAGAGTVVALVLVMTGYSEAFTSRAGELRQPGTSGYERFVAPYAAMRLPWEDSVTAVAWGYGAGRVEDLDTEYSANYTPVPKVFLEYGLVGLAAFAALWAGMFRRLAVPRSLGAAMLVMYFVAAGSLLQPYTVFGLWALTGGFRKLPAAIRGPGALPAGEDP